VGSSVGFPVGCDEGIRVGWADGCPVGLVGCEDGCDDGCVGSLDGCAEGFSVG
jgi:hypothetical protein